MSQRRMRLVRRIIQEVRRKRLPAPLPKCDNEIYKNGTQVFMTHTIGSQALEKWTRRIRRHLKKGRIDWHWAGGRAWFGAVGDVVEVKAALKKERAFHDKSYRKASKGIWGEVRSHVEDTIDGIWSYNEGMGDG